MNLYSKTSVLRSFGPFEDKEFDVHVKRILTTRQTNEIKAHPEIYKFIPKNQRFEHFEEGHFFEFGFRVVRFKISDDTYESIVTNLDENEFSLEIFIRRNQRTLSYALGDRNLLSRNQI